MALNDAISSKVALAGLGIGIAARGGTAEAQIRRYAELGRTGMNISDISFGADRLSPGQEDLVLHILDPGINYFDTADTYGGSDSELIFGKALRRNATRVFSLPRFPRPPKQRRTRSCRRSGQFVADFKPTRSTCTLITRSMRSRV
jgi:hypothetical protein